MAMTVNQKCLVWDMNSLMPVAKHTLSERNLRNNNRIVIPDSVHPYIFRLNGMAISYLEAQNLANTNGCDVQWLLGLFHLKSE